MCVHCLSVSWLSLSSNSGNVEMWKYVFIVLICLITLEVWKCGSVEMWKYVFIVLIYLITLEVWKCGNMSSLSSSRNSGSVEMWKYVFNVFI